VLDAEERTGQEDVVEAREVLVEPRAEREEARHLADDVDLPLVWPQDAGQHLEERALAGAVGPDHADGLAMADAEGDVLESPEWSAPVALQASLNDSRTVVRRVSRG
jgi:hypothetical protein